MAAIVECRPLSKAEAKREQLEDTGEWLTHPIFNDYLGSRDGKVYSLKSFQTIQGQKKIKYGYIAMNLRMNKEPVHITQHKFIFECFHGLMTGNIELTHCNGNEADNRLNNLKAITEQEEAKEFDSTKQYPHPKFSKYAVDVKGNIYVENLDRALKYQPNKAGYVEMTLTIDGESFPYAAHRLVYEAFHGLVDEKLQVDHRNTAKADNRIGNLTALTARAHSIKTRRDNPQMSDKRAATCSKALFRLRIDEHGAVTERMRFASAKLAVAASGSNLTTDGVGNAIREQRSYQGFMWEYEIPADLPDELWETFVDPRDGYKVTVSSAGRVKTSYGVSYGRDNGYGYMSISFGEHRKYLVHILICTAFHGPPPMHLENPTVDHDDRSRANNNSINLRWASRETQGLNRETTRKVLGFLLSDANTTFGPYGSIAHAGKALKVDESSLSKCCKGQRKSAGKHDGSALGWKYVDV